MYKSFLYTTQHIHKIMKQCVLTISTCGSEIINAGAHIGDELLDPGTFIKNINVKLILKLMPLHPKSEVEINYYEIQRSLHSKVAMIV